MRYIYGMSNQATYLLNNQETSASAGKSLVRKFLKGFFICFGLFLLFALCFCLYIGVFGGNVRAVTPGVMYRSAQLTGANYTGETARWDNNGLAAVLKRYHIHTVINLRGGSEVNDYYRNEVAQCRTAGAVHVDVPMSARHLPPPKEMDKLLYTFDHDPYPMIFHCQGGSDRSGLVGTLFLVIYRHVPLDKAEHNQLTWSKGHFAFTATGRMNYFFDLYRRTSSGMGMKEWILKKYPSVYLKYSRDPQT